MSLTSGSAVDAEKFRTFALSVYECDTVPAACLFLQNRYHVNVNHLLFAAFVGAVRRRRLSQADLAAMRACAGSWHSEVVEPLRVLRQRLKTGPAPAPTPATDELRRKVQAVEIGAELVELLELGRLVATLDGPRAPGDATECAAAAMAMVVQLYCGDTDGEDDSALTAIATAAARQERSVT
jgi:uncharacterized protein (TIGR02444 family)